MSSSLSSAHINTCLWFPPTEWNRLRKHKKTLSTKNKIVFATCELSQCCCQSSFLLLSSEVFITVVFGVIGARQMAEKVNYSPLRCYHTPCWIVFVSINVANACSNVSLIAILPDVFFELNTWSLLCPNVAMYQSWGLCSALSLFPYYLNNLI